VAPLDALVRRGIIRDALAVAAAVAVYGLSFGALAHSEGLSVPQASVLSAFAFTGASQFAFVGVVGAGGSAFGAVAVALLLGARNLLYAVRLTPLMRWRGATRLLGAHLTIDETTAMATAQSGPPAARLAFWATGGALWLLWNLSTLLGALAGSLVGSPERLGLDVAFPAAFLALLVPQLTTTRARLTSVGAIAVALALVPVVPIGVPVLVAALTVVPAALWRPE
jgi:4-azaleucine resistance transporter AzlC